MSLFFYLFTFAINLWHWELVTADITAVFVNNQHGIQRWDKILIKHINYLHSLYTVTRIEESKLVHLNTTCLHFLPYLLNICRKFEFLVSQGSVAICLS